MNAFFGWHFAVDCSGTPNGFVCRKVGTFFAFIGVGFSDGFGFVVFLLYFLWFLLPFLWSGYFKNFPAVAVARRELCGSCGMWSFSGDEEMGGELLLVLKVGLYFWYRNVMEP